MKRISMILSVMALVFAFTIVTVSAQNVPATKTSTEKVVTEKSDATATPAVEKTVTKGCCSSSASTGAKAGCAPTSAGTSAKSGCAATCGSASAKSCCSKGTSSADAAKPVPASDKK